LQVSSLTKKYGDVLKRKQLKLWEYN